ncbi:MAG: AAA family ATPase [Bdellovibrionales bacterium]|nr:AAA family ATPase [Bdellovibrionales bacterium]
MTKNKTFIGITGTNASGKGEVTQYLQTLGYTYLSLSDLLREIVRAQGLELSRDNLTNIGQQERKKSGPGFLATTALTKILPNTSYVIDSIRHPEEVRILKKALPAFELWAIDADPHIRFERATARGRDENAQTLDAFLSQEQKEMTDNPNAQQLHNTMKLAKITLSNNENVEKLHKQIQNALTT